VTTAHIHYAKKMPNGLDGLWKDDRPRGEKPNRKRQPMTFIRK